MFGGGAPTTSKALLKNPLQYLLCVRAGGNPWDINEKKAKKKKKVKVEAVEDGAEVLEDGDIRTKGTLTC